jgi:uncharacterized protein YjbI with pentapeptide repeats
MKTRRDIILLLGIILIIAVIALGFVFINNLSEYFFGGIESINAKGEFLKTILQICGGIVIVLGAYQSLKIVDSMNDNNKLVEKGNIAERFKNAITMLENKNSNTCLGGIYSLDNIAKDNIEYREQVFNILVSFINNKTKDIGCWIEIPVPQRFQSKPSIEVQTVIKVLFSKDKNLYRNLSGDFKDAKLYGGNYDVINFSNCSFTNVEFQNSSFRKTFFVDSNINKTNYTYSQIINADFTGSNIYKSILECCFFTFSHFTASRIQQTSFICSNINGADFQGSLLQKCNFDGARLSYFRDEANKFSFNAANVNGATIKGMRISGDLVARGAKFDVSQPVSSFKFYIKSYIGNKLEFKSTNKIEEFPEYDYERLKYLLDDPQPESKMFNHTLNSLKSDPSLNPSGWHFYDKGVFTKNDYNKLLKKYSISYNKVGLKTPTANKIKLTFKIRKFYRKLKKAKTKIMKYIK